MIKVVRLHQATWYISAKEHASKGNARGSVGRNDRIGDRDCARDACLFVWDGVTPDEL